MERERFIKRAARHELSRRPLSGARAAIYPMPCPSRARKNRGVARATLEKPRRLHQRVIEERGIESFDAFVSKKRDPESSCSGRN